MNIPQIPEWLDATLVLLGVLAVIFGPTAAIARWERRLVWPYVPLKKRDGSGPLDGEYDEFFDAPVPPTGPVSKADSTAFSVRENALAALEGFRPVGSFRDGKGRIYRIRYDFWLSEGGEILALVGGGTIAGVSVLNTWFHSLTTDGRCLVTLGAQNASEIDLGGLAVEALVAGGDFETLLAWHRRRIAATEVVPYSEADPLGDHLDYRRRRTDGLVDRGYAFYADPDRTAWRYTLKGAVALSFRAITQGMRRVFLPDPILGRLRAPRQA